MRNIIKISTIVILVTVTSYTFATTEQDTYAPQLFTGGGYGQTNNSYAGGGTWVPLYQNPTNVVFTQFTMPEYRKQAGFYESIDFGVRHLVPDHSLWGVFGGFSSIQGKTYNYDFYRATGGFEFQLPHWIFNVTAYAPIGDSSFDSGLSTSLVDDPDNANYKNILTDRPDIINNQPGGIVELGWRVPDSRGLTVYGGYYQFFRQHGIPNYGGPEFHLQYQLGTLFGWHANWLHHVNLDASWSDDNLNSSVYTVGVSVDIPIFGDSRYHNLSALQQAMEAPIIMPAVDRGIHNKRDTGQFFDMTNGQRTTVQEVSTKAELESATSSSDHADWVLLTNSSPINMGNDALDLANGVKLTGNGITLDDGQVFLANGAGNNRGITGTWSGVGSDAPAIRIANGGSNTIQYLTINNPNTTEYNAIANTYSGGSIGQGVGTVNINHVTANGSANFTIQDGSSTSNISFTNNNFDTAASPGAFKASFTSGSTGIIGDVTGNTLTESGTNGDGINLSGATINGDISDNTINTSGLNGFGISITNGELQSSGAISNNTITTTGERASGIDIVSNTGSMQISGNITGNIINTSIDALIDNRGGIRFRAGGGSTLTVSGDITDNDITNTGTGAAFFVRAPGTGGTVSFTGSITGNRLTSTAGNAMFNLTSSSNGTITYAQGLSGNTFIYDANAGNYGISNSENGGTISSLNHTTITNNNTFSPSAGSGNRIDNGFSPP